ncbi:hypothetical protein DFR57_108186 [Saliterribacillus persicus]|uniref:Uncharacterized protein n=1 Tax=Saliterribacillus persicus TaxID=930114 RepID=A0A368XGX4_9BACI|nr:hypothetical protein DFR57_108186 [Saliterribacillus persicus]
MRKLLINLKKSDRILSIIPFLYVPIKGDKLVIAWK